MGHRKFQFLRANAARWIQQNPVLDISQVGHEVDSDRFKLGDGVTPWVELDYFIPQGQILDLIQEEIQKSVGDGGTVLLADHIYAEEPHPAYDDGPSLLLLYKNAKV